MANVINGINGRIRPQVVVNQRVRKSATNVNGGTRVPLIIGEGLAEELIVASAFGGGQDGLNSDYSGSTAPDGRHFRMSSLDLVANRTEILKSGIPLVVLEEAIDSDTFDSRYGARVDPATGRIELQRSYLVDFGGDSGGTLFYKGFAANFGNGTLSMSAASLVETDAPAETWTVRCISTVKNAFNQSIPGEGRFSVTGSVSGAVRNADGDVITWKSDGVVVTNDILSFSISEGTAAFNVGDKFSIQVRSGALAKGDSLEARYIATEFLNSFELFLSPNDLFTKHGQPSATNTLALGAVMAFENGAPAVVTVQAKPSIPRKTTETLLAADNPLSTEIEGASGNENLADTIFALDLGALPNADSEIAIFIVDPDGTEVQLQLDKVDFYDAAYPTTSAAFTGFVTGPFSNSYTVIQAAQTEQESDGYGDGYVYTIGGQFFFTAPTISFAINRVDEGESDLDKQVIVYDLLGNRGTYNILEIGDGYGDMTLARVTLASGTSMIGKLELRWQLVDPADQGAYFVLSDDVVATYLTEGKGLKISYVDTEDADFFDTYWSAAYEAAESADAQFVVPLPTQTISAIFSAGKAHVIEMSSLINAKERILIVGAINGLTANNLLGVTDAAVEDIGTLEGIQGDDAEEVLADNIEDLASYSVTDAFGDTNRVVYMAPDQIVRNIAGTNTTLSGYWLAPAMAGFLSGKTYIAEPATNKTLSGFTIPRSRVYRPFVVNQLLDAGICLVEPVAGGGRIIHGLTTSQSDQAEDEEISIVEIRDQVVRSLRTALRTFVGRVNTPTIIAEVSGACDKLLRGMISLGLLSGYADLVVSRNPLEARQLDITLRAFPLGPINWISVDVEFSLSG